MHGALRGAMVLAVVPVLQACANGGAMQTTQSSPGTSGAQTTPSYGISGYDQYFKLEWQGDERRGKPMVSGYITNNHGLAMRNVRIRVEAFDAAGATTATYVGYVNGYVNPGSHIYWEVPVREKAASYRVTILSFDPVSGHG